MQTIFLVEDEFLVAEHLRDMLQEFGYEVVGTARRASEALQYLQQHPPPDLMLLDIMLRGELDGIDLANRLRAEHHMPFVFVTSLSDAATLTRAKHARPQGYLVKPFKRQDVLVALEMAFANHAAELATAPPAARPEPEPIEGLAHDSIFVRHRRQLLKVRFEELLWLQADGNYSVLHTATAKYAVSNALRQIEERLPAGDFIRVHKTYIVALRMISALDAHSVTVGDTAIPLGRAYQPGLMSRLNLLSTQ